MKFIKSGIISRSETDVLKGLGILCIVLHNFCHNINGATMENEFNFSLERSTHYFSSLAHGEHLFLNFFSYWGHFGVALFVFLTAYGLTRKSLLAPERMGQASGGATFVWRRAKKLWAIMLSAIILYVLINGGVYWLTGGWGQFYLRKQSLLVFTLLSNALGIWIPCHQIFGPWWYWGLAFELIVVYRLFVHGQKSWVVTTLTAFCLLTCLYVSYRGGNSGGMNFLKNNFVGWMLPFAAGIQIARHEVRFTWVSWLLAVALLIASCFNVYLWHFSQLFALIVLLGIGQVVKWEWLRKSLTWVGCISMFLFASHTMMRNWVQPYTTLDNFWRMLPLYLLLIFAVALLCKMVHNRLIAPYILRTENR